MCNPEKTETENAINRKLDALKKALELVLVISKELGIMRGYKLKPEKVLILLEEAWKEEEGD